MQHLRVPCADFMETAIRAGQGAGFEGAIVLLARGLGEEWETELKELWSDLDDITSNDILVISFGIIPLEEHDILVSDTRQRHVLADGVSVANESHRDLNEHFDRLLTVSDHVPELPTVDSKRRIFRSHGLTQVRQRLRILEQDIPAILFVGYRESSEFLVRLQPNTTSVSPATLIHEVSSNLEDIPYRLRELWDSVCELKGESAWQLRRLYGVPPDRIIPPNPPAPSDAERSAILSLRSKAADIMQSLAGRRKARERLLTRVRAATHNAPSQVQVAVENLDRILMGDPHSLKADDVRHRLVEYLDKTKRPSSRLIANVARALDHAPAANLSERSMEARVTEMLRLATTREQSLGDVDVGGAQACERLATWKQTCHQLNSLRSEASVLRKRIGHVFVSAVRRALDECGYCEMPIRDGEQSHAVFLSDDGVRFHFEPRQNVCKVRRATNTTDYAEECIEVLQRTALVMERAPDAFNHLNEEALRQHFLVQLGGHKEWDATAESFNCAGKTDILVRKDAENVLVVECKFWLGPKALQKGITQLLRYASSRDTSCALLVFVRGTVFSRALAGIDDAIQHHPTFDRFVGEQEKTKLRCTLFRPRDVERKIMLTVLVFDIP